MYVPELAIQEIAELVAGYLHFKAKGNDSEAECFVDGLMDALVNTFGEQIQAVDVSSLEEEDDL